LEANKSWGEALNSLEELERGWERDYKRDQSCGRVVNGVRGLARTARPET